MLLFLPSTPRTVPYGNVVGYVDPNMDVWRATEVPDERRPFQSPVVPHAIVADIAVRVESQTALVETTLPLEALPHLVLVFRAKRGDQRLEDLLQLLFLIGGQFGYGDAGILTVFATKANLRFARQFCNEGLLPLLTFEHLKSLVRRQPLVPEDIASVVWWLDANCVPIKDRAAECHVVGRVSISPQSHVPAGNHALELVAARSPEDCQALRCAPGQPLVVVVILFEKSSVPIGMNQPLEDFVDQVFLLFGVKISSRYKSAGCARRSVAQFFLCLGCLARKTLRLLRF